VKGRKTCLDIAMWFFLVSAAKFNVRENPQEVCTETLAYDSAPGLKVIEDRMMRKKTGLA
jgi:hypothetical protein